MKLRSQVFSVDYDNNTAPCNVPRKGETTAGTSNWKIEGIIFPRKSEKLQNISLLLDIICMNPFFLFH